MLIPKIGAIARAEAAKYSPVHLYSTNREDVEKAILAVAREQLVQVTRDVLSSESEERKARHLPTLPEASEPIVNLQDVLFRSVTLPHLVQAAIERKEEQFHVNLEYNFRLDRERKESERKAIEARGIQEFQRIVSDGITDAYLRWKGIDATLQLAHSNNSKIVIIGSGKDGLPIILNPFEGEARPGAHPAPALEARSIPPAATPNRPDEEGNGIYPNSSTADSEPAQRESQGAREGEPFTMNMRPATTLKQAKTPSTQKPHINQK